MKHAEFAFVTWLLSALSGTCVAAPPTPHHLDTQLAAAVMSGKVATVRHLLRLGADPNTRLEARDYRRGLTVLMEAALRNDSAIVAALIARGARIGTRDRHGFTALSYAAITDSPSCVSSLLGHGADPNARDVLGDTPLMFAAEANSVTRLSRGHARQEDHEASEVARTLLDAGAQANAHAGRLHLGDTALMDAAENGNVQTARVLLARGADVHATNDDGQTATIIARTYLQWRMLALLKRPLVCSGVRQG